MKFADLKRGTLFQSGMKPKVTCLILTERRYQWNKKAKKRHYYYIAGFYNHETKEVEVRRMKRTMMRAHMKLVQDAHLAEMIKTKSFVEQLK